MAKIRRKDWTTDFHVRYIAFRDVEGMTHLRQRQFWMARRGRFLRWVRGIR